MTQPARLLTIPQVVERLAELGIEISDETVRQWAKNGRLRAVQLPSGRFRFRREDVDAIAVPTEQVAS
jgi:excisionase family DNA binding protein